MNLLIPDLGLQFHRELNKCMVLPKWMIRVIGLFKPVIRESVEMLYQSEYDYLFDSSKFEKAFNFVPTPYETGIRRTAEVMKARE